MTEAELALVREIEAMGYQVKFSHVRRFEIHEEYYAPVGVPLSVNAEPRLDPCGGYCEAVAVKEAGPIANAIVLCSQSDNYVKREGRIKALGRLKATLLQAQVEA